MLQEPANFGRAHLSRSIDQLRSIVFLRKRDEVEHLDLESIGQRLERLNGRARQAPFERRKMPLRAELALVSELFDGEPGFFSKLANPCTHGLG